MPELSSTQEKRLYTLNLLREVEKPELSHAENLDRFLCRKNCLTGKLTQRLRDRSFSLRGGVAYAAAYATLRHCRLCLRSIDMT